MTYDEFLVQLSDIDTEWYTESYGLGSSQCIRTVIAGKEYCPVTAVVNHVTGNSYEIDCFDYAAKDIELNPDEANAIATAADEDACSNADAIFNLGFIDPILHSVIRGSLLENTIGKAS